MRSTKTRIETRWFYSYKTSQQLVTIWDPPKQGLKPDVKGHWGEKYMSQYEIHQNKDWNIEGDFDTNDYYASQYEIHQNKDWNLLWRS